VLRKAAPAAAHSSALSWPSAAAGPASAAGACNHSRLLHRLLLQEALEARSQLRSELEASREECSKLGQQVQALAGELARHRDALQQEKLSAASQQVGAGHPLLPGDLPAAMLSYQPAGRPRGC
jgi:hypothetical protein